MKFFFSKTDNLYKIFKTIEKIPTSRKVEIFIDPEHSIFENEWWGKQIKEILDQKQVDAVFTTKNRKNKEYYEHLGVQVNFQGQTNLKKIFSLLSDFFFNIKKFHIHTYETEKYIFVVLFLIELLFVVGILWFIVSLIIPHAEIRIKPAEDTDTLIYNFRYYPWDDSGNIEPHRYLNIPYYTGSLDYQLDLSISASNIKYAHHPSQGYVKVYNTTDEIALMASTRFVTEDGLVFRAVNNFVLSTGTYDHPSETRVLVKADDVDEQNKLIGVRGNLSEGTPLWIRNLNSSYYFKEIWAESVGVFSGGSTQSTGFITDEDRTLLKEKLIQQVYAQKLNIVRQAFPIDSGLFLDFDSITTTDFHDIVIHEQTDDQNLFLKGSAYVTYTYTYVLQTDIMKAFHQYLQERTSDENQILATDLQSITFIKDTSMLEGKDVKKSENLYIIPTQIKVIKAYDFSKDTNSILPLIKENIAGKSMIEAKKYLLSTFEEIGNVEIVLSPFWHTTIPSLRSRIKIAY